MIRRPPRSTRTDTLFLHDALPILVADIGAGVAYAVRHPGIGPLLALHLVASIMVRPILELLPGFAGHVFRGGADTLATLTSTVGIGAVIAALLLARRAGTKGLVALVLSSSAGISLVVLLFVATDMRSEEHKSELQSLMRI